MGVYIEGMEMPKEEIVFSITPDGKVQRYDRMFGNTFTFGKKFEAFPVPPHGRLIDADAFFKDICDSLNEMTAIGIAVDGEWMWGKLNDALNNAPTIIEAEEGEKNV